MERGICRACIIYGCKTCTTEGQDTCAVCSSGYRLTSEGKCENANMMQLDHTPTSSANYVLIIGGLIGQNQAVKICKGYSEIGRMIMIQYDTCICDDQHVEHIMHHGPRRHKYDLATDDWNLGSLHYRFCECSWHRLRVALLGINELNVSGRVSKQPK